MNIFLKLLISFKKNRIIIVFPEDKSDLVDLVSSVFNNYIENEKIKLPLNKFNCTVFLKNKVAIIEPDIKNKKELKDLKFLIENSVSPVLILEKEVNESDLRKIMPLIKAVNRKGEVITDFKTSKKIVNTKRRIFKIGVNKESDLWISDLNVSDNTNFKINHHGDTVPFWLGKNLTQNKIKSVLFAIATGMAFNLNLVEMSQNLKRKIEES